jgi:hypothetical protein
MKNNWKEIVESISRLSPFVQWTLVVVFSGVLILIMLHPTAGTALTSFLVTLSLVVDRFYQRDNHTKGQE